MRAGLDTEKKGGRLGRRLADSWKKGQEPGTNPYYLACLSKIRLQLTWL